jgi:hypothetical protein
MDLAVAWLIFFVLIGFAFLVFLWWSIQEQAEAEKKVRAELAERVKKAAADLPEAEWDVDEYVAVNTVSKGGVTMRREVAQLGLNREKRQFMAVWASAPYRAEAGKETRFTSGIWSIDKILGVQIAINEEKSTITSGKIGGKAGGALVGTLLFGVAGGIVGSSGSREINSRSSEVSSVVSLALEIQLADPDTPYLYIHFFFAEPDPAKLLNQDLSDKRASVSLDQLREKGAFRSAQRWHALLSESIQSGKEKLPNKELAGSTSISEEIGRLHNLLKEGVITESEFAAAKKVLLEKPEKEN